MSENVINQSGKNSDYADDRGGATLYSHPIIGIVKNNVDLMKSGKIQVYLKRQNLPNEDNPSYWTTVNYMSPFFGYTPNTASPDANGDYVGNPNSYGFWATPPDIGTEVVCIFINGDPNFGYYIGALPKPALTHMVPGVGASNNVIPNEGEAVGYGGATRLPVSEYNNANTKQDDSSLVTESPRPIHSYQAAILNAQGLIRDTDRGVIGSSSMRESPSRVFGMSTPGRPIYEGGYTDESIASAIKTDAPPLNYKVIGRRGGHSIVMDDGDLQGRDQLTRIRTAGGHMIMMNDFAQTLFIIHANGSSYIELGKEGTIDLYSTNSVNIRTQGDLNLHADNNININAVKDLNLSAKNVHIESIEETTQFAGTNNKQYTKGEHTLKVEGKMTLQSKGDSMIKSGGTNYIKGGPNVNLNTGESSLVPQPVKQIPITAHTDTLRDSEKGYIAAPAKLPSIVSRAPAHMPWVNSNQGVDVKTDLSASANLPSPPPTQVVSANTASADAKITPTTAALTATVPSVPSAVTDTNNIGGTNALISQAAVTMANGPAANAIKAGAGVVDVDGLKTAAVGSLGLSPKQLEQSGIIKPGSAPLVDSLVQQGKSLAQALPTNLFTGKDGATSLTSFVNNPTAQVNSMSGLLDKAKTSLVDEKAILGTESLTQTGGAILGAAMNGTGPVVDFMKQAATGQTDLAKASATKLTNDLFGPTIASIKSGNFAANISDKLSGSLGGIEVGDALKGSAAGAFDKIKNTLKNLKAGVPQTLTGPTQAPSSETPAAEPTPEQKAEMVKNNTKLSESIAKALGVNPGGALRTSLENAGSSITNAVGPGVATTPEEAAVKMQSGTKALAALIPGISSSDIEIPGGLGSFTNIVKADGPSITGAAGVSGLTDNVKGIASQITSGIDSMKSKAAGIGDAIKNKGDLSAALSTGLPPDIASELNGAVSSLGAGGAVKAPTVAFDTNNIADLLNQSKSLLGNPKIPPINLGNLKIPTQPLSPEKVQQYDALKKQVAEADDQKWAYRKTYLDNNMKYGADAPQTIEAKAKYEEILKKIEDLNKQLSDIAQGQ